ncbi:RHS repeat-associated core domain-containing protein, partial [Thalassoglobus neptunius]|uniref:RHS repeat-associated core domain-containing protein n=1 Tax=Thalassoglobus neptunius TaxID=1938619 RepID=UPI0011B71FAD
VWGNRYIDECVLRDRDYNNNGTTLEERLYATQDANWNTTMLYKQSSGYKERYTYNPYGEITFLNSSFNPVGGSVHNWQHLFGSYRRDTTTELYLVRNRLYHTDLGTWLSRDPIGYNPTLNLYEYVSSNPTIWVDGFGFGPTWHHLLTESLGPDWKNRGFKAGEWNKSEYGLIIDDTWHTANRGGDMIEPYWRQDWQDWLKKNPNARKPKILEQLEKMKTSDKYSKIISKGKQAPVPYCGKGGWTNLGAEGRAALAKKLRIGKAAARKGTVLSRATGPIKSFGKGVLKLGGRALAVFGIGSAVQDFAEGAQGEGKHQGQTGVLPGLGNAAHKAVLGDEVEGAVEGLYKAGGKAIGLDDGDGVTPCDRAVRGGFSKKGFQSLLDDTY